MSTPANWNLSPIPAPPQSTFSLAMAADGISVNVLVNGTVVMTFENNATGADRAQVGAAFLAANGLGDDGSGKLKVV